MNYFIYSVFWDLYCAAPERRETCEHSSEAKAFHDYVSIWILSQSSYFQRINTWSRMWQRRANIRVWPGVIVQFGTGYDWICFKNSCFMVFYCARVVTLNVTRKNLCITNIHLYPSYSTSDNRIILFSTLSIHLADILTG